MNGLPEDLEKQTTKVFTSLLQLGILIDVERSF